MLFFKIFLQIIIRTSASIDKDLFLYLTEGKRAKKNIGMLKNEHLKRLKSTIFFRKKGSMSSSAKQRIFSKKKERFFSFLNQLFIAIDLFLSLCFINFRK